ncbi:MAG TPA: hypothetical protein VIL09_12710 [Microvirga sp.]
MDAFLGDLLFGAKISAGRWVFRSRQAKSFSGGEVTYRQFKAVYEGLQDLGLVEVVNGFNATKTVVWADGPSSQYQQGKAARFRATPSLLDLASRTGVEVGDAGRHFQEAKPRDSIILKDSSHRVGMGKIPGRPMAFARTPKVQQLEDNVHLIDDFLTGIDIKGGTHRGFIRIFNLGDQPTFNWNKGGRLYSVGDDCYQRLKKHDRLKMTLGGEPVAEIDISASYLTILHGHLGQALDATGDLYDLPGAPREVVKGWLVATLSNQGHLKRWPMNQAKAFLQDTGQKLSEAYPLKKVREAMVAKYPVLAAWGEIDLDWADLMFRESEAVIGTMIHLIKAYEIPSLPVHDSLLVPVSQISQCRNLLIDHYRYQCRIEPQVRIERPDL